MLGLGDAMRDTNDIQDHSVKWPDFREGIDSFVERRPPKFPPLRLDS